MENNHGLINSTTTLRLGRYLMAGAAQPGNGAGLGCPHSQEQMPLLPSSAHPQGSSAASQALAEPKHRWLKVTAGAQGRGSSATALCPQPLPAQDSLCTAEHLNTPQQPQDVQLQPQSLLFSRSSPHQQARTRGMVHEYRCGGVTQTDLYRGRK